MPLYTLQNAKTKKQKTVWMSWDSLQSYTADNPEWSQIIVSPPALCQPTRVGVRKNSRMFKDRMDEIQKANPKGKIEY